MLALVVLQAAAVVLRAVAALLRVLLRRLLGLALQAVADLVLLQAVVVLPAVELRLSPSFSAATARTTR